MYESIIVQATRFEEGQFWVIDVLGYKDNNSFDDPDNIKTEHVDDESEEEMENTLFDIALEMLSKTNKVNVHFNGNEIKTITPTNKE